MREIVVDTETTGLNHKDGDRIIELACVELINHVASGNNLQFYCFTDKKISNEAFKISGLSNKFLKKFPPFSVQAKNFFNFIKNDTLIIHNADFDIGFINNELKLMGAKKIKNQVVDTMDLARKKLDTRITNLDYLCKRFSIDTSERNFHGALLDCKLLAEVYLELLGGKQSSLTLNISQESNNISQENKQKTTPVVHTSKTTRDDIAKHKNFVADLKNALWHKVDY